MRHINSFIFSSVVHYFAIIPLTKLPQTQGLKRIQNYYFTVCRRKVFGMGLTKLKLKCLQAPLFSGGFRGQSHWVSWQNWIHYGCRNKALIFLLSVRAIPNFWRLSQSMTWVSSSSSKPGMEDKIIFMLLLSNSLFYLPFSLLRTYVIILSPPR